MTIDNVTSTDAAKAPHPDSVADTELEAIARDAEAPIVAKRVIVKVGDLKNILREVLLVRAVVQTASQALHYMNIEESDDIADVLSHHADDALGEPINALREILGRVPS